MIVDQHELYVTSTGADASVGGTMRRFLRELAPQDFIVLAYLMFLNAAVLNAPSSSARIASLVNVSILLVVHVTTVVAIRTRWLNHRLLTPALYRIVTYGCVQMTYFMFAELLPLANPRELDLQLYRFDLTYFGIEPAAYLDRFVTPP